jgi:peptidoglycan hydrolase-like protein with peptidoglycan-binding domain
MRYQKLFVVMGMLGIATIMGGQQSPSLSSQSSQPNSTPFIADPTQVELPGSKAAPTAVPNTRFPVNPIAPLSQKTQEAPPAESGVARAEPVSEREVITRLQIFIDQRSFGPGKIDGRWGEFVAKALQRYQTANGLEPSGQIDSSLQQQLQHIFPIYTTYQLTEEDFKRVGTIPYKPAEQAKVKAMLYRSMAEFIAERYHSGENFITKLNSDKKLESLRPGDTVRVPNVPPFQIETFKEVGSLPIRPELARRTVKIDTRYRMLDVMEGDKLIS